MKTQLDEKQELIDRLEILTATDVRALKVFIAGMDAGKTLQSLAEKAAKERDEANEKTAG